MPKKLSKEAVSLLSATITEICDESEEDDFIPFAAVAECIRNDQKFYFEPPKKKIKSSNVIKDRLIKFLRPSRFEKVETIQFPQNEEDRNICKKTLKPISKCICPEHCGTVAAFVVNEKGGAFISDIGFKTHWRMSRTTVETIYQVICSNQLEISITPIQFLAAVWRLTTDEALEFIETRFQVPRDEIPSLERTVFDSLIDMRFDFERWPRGVAATLTKEGFRAVCRMPGVIGVLDSVHFQCNGLPYPKNFENQNNEKTVIFQLTCDHRGSFTNSSYFWLPGKWTSHEVYEHSNIASFPINNAYLLGGQSYAPFKNIITPYADVNNELERNFNFCHNKAMDVLRTAVFSLVTRFKALRCLRVENVWVARKKVAACLLLHNICVDLEDLEDPDTSLVESSFFPPPRFPPLREAENVLRARISSEIADALN